MPEFSHQPFFSGLLTVANWDLRQRARSRKLIVVWIVWAVVLAVIALGIVWIGYQVAYDPKNPSAWRASSGPAVFGFTVLLMLAFSLVIVPVFSASAIVAEREAATLATLQATTLQAAQIVGGKLLAACVIAAAFLAGGAPALGIAVTVGHINVGRALVCLVVVYAEMVFLCAIAMGWSAVAARTLISTVLTYLTVFVLTFVSVLAMVLLSALTITYDYDRTWSLSQDQQNAYTSQLTQYFQQHPTPDGSQPPAPPLDQCFWQTATYPTSHTHVERVWWLLLGNPFVVVSDAAPLPPDAKGDLDAYLGQGNLDPLAGLAALTREARFGSPSTYYDCFTGTTYLSDPTSTGYDVAANPDGTFTVTNWKGGPSDRRTTAETPRPPTPGVPQTLSMTTPLWPLGLATHLVLAAFFFWVAVRKVTVPYGALPKGQRVA